MLYAVVDVVTDVALTATMATSTVVMTPVMVKSTVVMTTVMMSVVVEDLPTGTGTQTLRHMTMRPTSSRVLAAMPVVVFLAGCSNAGGSSDSCEPGVSPCDDTNELQTFFPEVVPQS